MSKRKRDKSIHLRMTERLKAEVQDQAHKNAREIGQEILVLIAEALHDRKFNPKEWL